MSTKSRQPAVFVPHGGGQGDPSYHEVAQLLRGFRKNYLTTTPDAIIVVSAHWEASVPSISSAGHPKLAKKIQTRINLLTELDGRRGLDHGAFVPLQLMFPDADVPVLQVSILKSLDPEQHIRLGEALSSLRDENMLIVGSGMSFHNFQYFFGDSSKGDHLSEKFHEYLTDALVETTDPVARRKKLVQWGNAPCARDCHPREEHLLPLLVTAGAGLDEPCEEIFAGKITGVRSAAYLFGATRLTQ